MNRRGGVSRVGVRWWVAALTWAAACARELDPATCARRFDVQRDKIIRTEESQDMGARYLSELDVAARDQCLRLCCETDQCDVFVYEEKSPGNCYLFACGPPEDFRCKFTAHGNFSSGVLALSRRLAELQDVERLHLRDRDRDRDRDGDRDLIDLRKAASTSGPPAAPAPAQAHSAPPPTARPTTAKAGRRCSRYQFECRSGGECVAVYNACDGVPQCADGSDEAPELGCPASPAPAAPPTPQPRQPARNEYVPSKESGESSEGARWPHRLLQAQPARYADNGPSSHIFSHKGGLVQDTDGGVGVGASAGGGTGPFTPFEAGAGAGAWPRRPWSHNAAQGLGLETGAGMGVRWGGGEFPRYEWAVGAALGAPDPRRGWPVPPAPQPPPRLPAPAAPETPVAQEVGVNGYATKTMPEMAAYPEQQHALHDGPKKGFDLMNGEPAAPPPAAGAPPVLAAAPPAAGVIPAAGAPPAPTARNDDNKSSPQTAQQKVARARARTSEVVGRGEPASGVGVGALLDDHDGLSESPPAAVLLLVLGVAMTSALGAVVACRWRGARRRGRRRGPFAHDADYLVNGMYL